MTLLAFHNDVAVKAKYIDRVRGNISEGNLQRGATGQDGKGGGVWCKLSDTALGTGVYDYSRYPIELGIPEWLARLADNLFEGMSLEKSKTWPLVFLDAIEVGDDLERIKAPFLIMVLENALESFGHEKFPKVVSAIKDVIALWRRPDVSSKEWDNAVGTAYNASDNTEATFAYGFAKAAAATAATVAYYAAYAAVAAKVAYPAEAVVYAAADAKAKFDEFADKLIEMIKNKSVGL